MSNINLQHILRDHGFKTVDEWATALDELANMEDDQIEAMVEWVNREVYT